LEVERMRNIKRLSTMSIELLIISGLALTTACLEDKNKGGNASAVFTTFDANEGGCLDSQNGVNCNHYKDKANAYVAAGGKADDGDYFFAVLTPGAQNSGFVDGAVGNLSSDSIGNRTFSVTKGLVTYTGSHKLGMDPTGRPAIKLAPYNDTDNEGGVYVVAVCKVGAQNPSDCKFDNFKIYKVAPPRDTTAPYLAILRPTNGALVGGAVDFAAIGSDENFDAMACSAGGYDLGTSGIGSVEALFNTRNVADGTLTFSCSAWDKYGNSSAASVAVEVDNTPPVLIIDSPTNGSAIFGINALLGSAYDAHPGNTACSLDGIMFMSTPETALSAEINTLGIIDGTSNIHCDSVDQVGNASSVDLSVVIDNMSIKVMPQSLNLTSKGKDTSVTVTIKGVNVALLTPIQSRDLKLRVPGGADVPVNASFGSGGAGDTLMIKFDRGLLIPAIQEGIAKGAIKVSSGVTLTLFSGHREIGSDWIKLVP